MSAEQGPQTQVVEPTVDASPSSSARSGTVAPQTSPVMGSSQEEGKLPGPILPAGVHGQLEDELAGGTSAITSQELTALTTSQESVIHSGESTSCVTAAHCPLGEGEFSP